MSSPTPVNGNSHYGRVRNLATADLQRVKAGDVQATTISVSLTSVGPTGAVGPYGPEVVPGQIVLASTGPLGPGPLLGFYTGSKWVYTSLA